MAKDKAVEGAVARRVRLRKAIGARIEEARTERGLSTLQLATRFGEVGAKTSWLDRQTVWALEQGKRAIDIEDFNVLAEAFGVPVQFFIAPLLPEPANIDPEVARRRAQAGYSQFLQRESKRQQQKVAKTLNDPEFLQMIGDLAHLPEGRRRQVRDTIEGLHALEDKRRKQ